MRLIRKASQTKSRPSWRACSMINRQKGNQPPSLTPPFGLYGAFFVKEASRISVVLRHSILLFDLRRKHSFVPTAHLHRRRAQRRSRTALRQRRRRLVLDGREHGGRLLAIGWLARAMIRGEPAIGRDQSREPRLYSVEPVWGADHEAVIRFCGQGSEAAGPFSQRHCSHSRMRIAATSDRHRLPGASSAVRRRTLFVLSRYRVLLTPPAAVRHRPAPRRS